MCVSQKLAAGDRNRREGRVFTKKILKNVKFKAKKISRNINKHEGGRDKFASGYCEKLRVCRLIME